MKKLLIATALALSTAAFADDKPVETKKTCIKVYDSNQKKDVEKCKKVKIHKKHEGKTVPTN
jgi:hypothetical protein